MTESVGTKAASREATNKAYRLVGEFMQSWSFVENELNRGIAKLAGLGTLEAVVLRSNMGVRDKIHALKTLLYMFSLEADRNAAVALLNTAASMSESRNMIAHTMFWAHEKGGVEFAVVKAKGKLDFPRTVWGEAMFKEKFVAMAKLQVAIKSAVNKAARIRTMAGGGSAENPFRNALTMQPPSEGLLGLGALSSLFLPAQDSPGSPTPSPQTEPQTLAAPPEKPEARKKQKSEKK